MSVVMQDLRFALRQLRRSPLFSLTALLTLAVAVGATAAMSGVLRATLLHPLPYPHAERLVKAGDVNLRGFKSNGLIAVARTTDLAGLKMDGQTVFEAVSFLYLDPSSLSWGGQEPLQVSGAAVSGEFFRTIGTEPLLGRVLTPADDVVRGPQSVVLSYKLWVSKFAGDRGVIGRTIRLGPQQATVVGVMPKRFALPSSVDAWHAARISAASFAGYRGDGSRFVTAYGRLREGVTLEEARRATGVLAGQLATAYPATDVAWGFTLNGLRESLFGDYKHALVLLSAAVGLVLLTATVNLANLLLSRNAERDGEFAVRRAVGASRGRLLRQMVTESMMLVVAGSAAGAALGWAALRVFSDRLPQALLVLDRPQVDGVVLMFSVTVATVVGIGAGIVPALFTTRAGVDAGRTLVRGTRRYGRGFTVAQIALALVLLTLTASVVQGLYRLLHTPLGFVPDQLQTCSVDLPWGADSGKTHQLYAEVQRRVAALAGVSAVGAIQALPLESFSVRRTMDIAGQPTAGRDGVVAEGRTVSGGYLRAMGIPLLAGRDLNERDGDAGVPGVALVNATFARRYFPGKSAVGQRLTWPGGPKERSSDEIVGVIGDVRGTGGELTAAPQAEIYEAENGGWPHMKFAIRSGLDRAALEPAVKRIVAELDGGAAVGHFSTVTNSIEGVYAQPRLNAGVLSGFAGVSLLLVVIGVYGLVAFEVTQRGRELGLRMALGSSRSGIVALLVADAAWVLGLGLVLGAAGGWAAGRVLVASFVGVTIQPVWLAAAAVTVGVAVLVATLGPLLKATRIDPMLALRGE